MKRRLAACSSVTLLSLFVTCVFAARPDTRFKDNDHLTALQLYKLGGASDAIREVIGRMVFLDVVLSNNARERALATIPVPKGLRVPQNVSVVMNVHLVGGSPLASLENLKAGDQLKIEGVIVDSCYGAYTVYVLRILD